MLTNKIFNASALEKLIEKHKSGLDLYKSRLDLYKSGLGLYKSKLDLYFATNQNRF